MQKRGYWLIDFALKYSTNTLLNTTEWPKEQKSQNIGIRALKLNHRYGEFHQQLLYIKAQESISGIPCILWSLCSGRQNVFEF